MNATRLESPAESKASLAIWGLAFGYFAAYVPYSALTKALSRGLLPGMEAQLSGPAILPVTLFASAVSMVVFLNVSGWIKLAPRRRVFGLNVPTPGPWTFLSGLATAAVIITTTLAYTFEGVSIVFVMLLMRGGVLIIAPMVDLLSKRKVRWFSWVGLGLSLVALVTAVGSDSGAGITLVCAIDIAVYLASYFVRLRFMSRLAKSDEPDANKRFFVEEQLVAAPAALLFTGVLALIGSEGALGQLREGFALRDPMLLAVLFVVGVLSQGTGIFGGLILLDKRENTFCVPVNRASSVLAGVVASFALATLTDLSMPANPELFGAALVIAAILVLSLPPALETRRKRAAEAAAATLPSA